MIKAFRVAPCENVHDQGCLLVCAGSRNLARSYAQKHGPWLDPAYIDMHAWRTPDFDGVCDLDYSFSIETNDELPPGYPQFYAEIIG